MTQWNIIFDLQQPHVFESLSGEFLFDLEQQTDLLQFVISVQAANDMIHRLQEREHEERKVKDGWIDFYNVT